MLTYWGQHFNGDYILTAKFLGNDLANSEICGFLKSVYSCLKTDP